MKNKLKMLLITTTLTTGLTSNTYADRTYMCKSCPTDTFANDNKCDACPVGYQCKNGLRTKCPEGSISKEGWCIGCTDGSFAENNVCKSCPAGFACQYGLKHECPDGTYAKPSSEECTPVELRVSMEYACMKCSDEKCEQYVRKMSGLNPYSYDPIPDSYYAKKGITKTLKGLENFYQPPTYRTYETFLYSRYFFNNCFEDKTAYRIIRFNNVVISHPTIYDMEIVSSDKTTGEVTTVKLFFNLDSASCDGLKNDISKQLSPSSGMKIINSQLVERIVGEYNDFFKGKNPVYSNVCEIELSK